MVTLDTSDNEKLNDLLSEGFERSIFWNEYKSKIETHESVSNNLKTINLGTSFQGANRLFVLAYDIETANEIINMNSPRRCALPRVKLTKFSVLIDGKNFHDQPISSDIKKYEELLKPKIGRGESYETGCLLDSDYYKNHY